MGAQFGAAALPLGLPSLGPFLRAEFGLSLFWLGALLVAPTAGLAAASYWWGSASDRWGERRVIVTGMAGAAASPRCAIASQKTGSIPLPHRGTALPKCAICPARSRLPKRCSWG